MSHKEETDFAKLERLMLEAAVAVGKALACQLEYNLDKDEIKEFLAKPAIERQEYIGNRITEEWFAHDGLAPDIEAAMSGALEALHAYDFVITSDSTTGKELCLVVDSDGEELARCKTADIASQIADAMNLTQAPIAL